MEALLRAGPWCDRSGRISVLKSVTFLMLWYPAAWMVYYWQADAWLVPQGDLTYWSGVWALVVLLLSLSVTPLRRLLNWPLLILIRRMVGVAALAYSVAHLVIYFWLRFFDAQAILEEMTTRLSLILATVSFVGLLALGVTSFDAAIRAMGPVSWRRLHALIHVLTALAVAHFILSPGSYGGLPFLSLGIYVWLIGWRQLERRRLGSYAPALAMLGLIATIVTILSEVIAPSLLLEMDAWTILSGNFSLALGLAPGWKMLGLSVLLTAAAAWTDRPVQLA